MSALPVPTAELLPALEFDLHEVINYDDFDPFWQEGDSGSEYKMGWVAVLKGFQAPHADVCEVKATPEEAKAHATAIYCNAHLNRHYLNETDRKLTQASDALHYALEAVGIKKNDYNYEFEIPCTECDIAHMDRPPTDPQDAPYCETCNSTGYVTVAEDDVLKVASRVFDPQSDVRRP